MLKKQMSDSIWMGVLLAITGGFLDAYTYISRGGVFANAQTGNVVLFSLHIAKFEWRKATMYLIPIMAFVIGIFVTEMIRTRFLTHEKLHWRQLIVLLEALILLVAAFLPQSYNIVVNIMISFVCALQVESFRKIEGNVCATTMCTGNLRTATELLFRYYKEGNKKHRNASLTYFFILFVFVVGASIGSVMTQFFFEKAVLFCVLLLLVSCILMAFKGKEKVEIQ